MAKVFGWLESAGEKALHVVEEIPSAAATIEKLLVDGQAVEPAIKAGLVTPIQECEASSITLTSVAASKGASWTSDAAAVAQVQQLVKDFIAFLPTLESAGTKLVGDVSKMMKRLVNIEEIATALDAEISRLQQARDAIAGFSSDARRNGRPSVSPTRKAKRSLSAAAGRRSPQLSVSAGPSRSR
jgi:hypothetical protein